MKSPNSHLQNFPQILYGTAWKEDRTTSLTRLAIESGFRGIDTANQRKHYFEQGVGNALNQIYDAGSLTRSDLFLQTKFTYVGGQDQRLPYDPRADVATQVQQSFASSLEHLQTNYLDSYILHGPQSGRGLTSDDFEVWQEMEKLHALEKTRFIGVSNCNLGQLRELVQHAKIKPAFAQIRCYAVTGWDKEIRKFCAENHIIYQGFSLLTANNQVLQHPKLSAIAAKYQKTNAQVIYRFSQQIGMLPLTGTTNAKHIAEALDSSHFSLAQSEIDLIEGLAN